MGKSDVGAVERLCAAYPDARFMVTMLAREDQHELSIAARKFPNLFLFGCWWFLNVPSLIEEMTRMRFELLGTSVLPQHSDARVLDQVICGPFAPSLPESLPTSTPTSSARAGP